LSNDEGIFCKELNNNLQILCGGCYAIETVKVVQRKIDALVTKNKGLVSLGTRLDLIITKGMLEQVINAEN